MQPLQQPLKVLVVIPTWGTKNDRYLFRLIEEYRSMPFEVHIVVLSNIAREIAEGVEVVVVRPKNRLLREFTALLRYPWLLRDDYRTWKRHLEFPFAHKQILAERQNEYDLFIYSEDDMLITENNIRAFLKASAVLSQDEIPGFLRFEQSPDHGRNYPEFHGIFHWEPQSVRRRGDYTLAFFTCEHAACYLLTQQQLQNAIESGGFLVPAHSEKYDLLCTAATDPYTQCGFQKVICISHMEDFLVHHLPNKYVGTSFGVNDAEMQRQVESLLEIERNGHTAPSLFATETKFRGCRYSKNYYEPVMSQIVSQIPASVRTVLSIGCEWGATEALLAERGLSVVAVPLDPVIAGRAKAKGVEIVNADLAALKDLKGRRFDCLLLLNVLHLVPDPVALLSSLRTVLSPGAATIIMAPNFLHFPVLWRKILGDERFKDVGSYSKTGVQFTSHKTVRAWLQSAGMKLDGVINVLPKRARWIRPFTFGLTDQLLASEFVAMATKT
jgi:2-polyprenyl-3-methyl-5-hydroxy-6-metoxy-1,4-benzoquinol methylase